MFKLLLALLVFFYTFGCQKANKGEKVSSLAKLEQLRGKYNERLAEAKKSFDQENGWPSKDDCDGTLWAGLARAAGVDTVNLEAAEYNSGELHRTPSPDHCFAEGTTSVSRDMVLGYAYGSIRSGDGDAIKRLLKYGESHNWIMGEPGDAIGEVLLTGNLIGLLGRATCELNGYCPVYKNIQPVHSKSEKDYVRHLTVLFILLDGEVNSPLIANVVGNITSNEKEVLQWHADQDRNDLLFQTANHLYTDGDFNEIADKLLAENSYIPSYVRGNANYPLVHWLFVTKLILQRY